MATLFRINCLVTLVFALLLLACGSATIAQARVDIERELAASFGLIAAFYNNCAEQNGGHCAAGPELIAKLSGSRHVSVDSGVVGSNADVKQEKSAPLWFSALVWRGDQPGETVMLADGQSALRSDPSDEIAEVWEGLVQLCWLICACALVANLAVYIGGRASLKPIRRFLQALDQIERGNYRERLPAYPIAEANRLAEHFNRMASALECQQGENRLLNRQLINLQEQERRDLARELHDDLGQHLAAIKVIAGTVELSPAAAADPAIASNARKIISISSDVLSSFRGLIHRLRPAVLDRADFYQAARQLCREWQDSVGIECRYVCADSLPVLSAGQSIHLYRILQEALNNVLKHSGTSMVEVSLGLIDETESATERLFLRVVDKGNGLIAPQKERGMGMRFMTERAHLIGGRLQVEAVPGRGCRLSVELDLVSCRDNECEGAQPCRCTHLGITEE